MSFLFLDQYKGQNKCMNKSHLENITKDDDLVKQKAPRCRGLQWIYNSSGGLLGTMRSGVFIKRLFHIRSKVSQNKTKQIKCNDINKNIILLPNNVVPQKRLWLQP